MSVWLMKKQMKGRRRRPSEKPRDGYEVNAGPSGMERGTNKPEMGEVAGCAQ